MLRCVVEKAIESEFSLTLGKFYMFYVHVLYTQCRKFPFSKKHGKWQLRPSENLVLWELLYYTGTMIKPTIGIKLMIGGLASLMAIEP